MAFVWTGYLRASVPSFASSGPLFRQELRPICDTLPLTCTVCGARS
jgi:hypothetical protein